VNSRNFALGGRVLVFGCACAALTVLSFELFRRGSQSMIALYPVPGFAVAAMLRKPDRRLALAVACAAGTYAGATLVGRPIPMLHLYAAVTVGAEAWLVASLMLRYLPHRPEQISGVRDLIVLVVASTVGTFAITCASVLQVVFDPVMVAARAQSGNARLFVAWWFPDLVGCLLLTPAMLRALDLFKRVRRPSAVRVVEVTALVGFLGLGVWQLQWGGDGLRIPIGVGDLPLLIWAALRFGPAGTTWVGVVVSANSIGAVALGRGPFVSISPDPFTQQLWCELYCVISMLSMQLLAGALHQQRTLAEALAASNRELQAASARMQAYLAATEDQIAVVDVEMRLTMFTQSWAREFARQFGVVAAVGRSLVALVEGSAESELYLASWRRALSGDRHTRTQRSMTPANKETEFDAVFTPLCAPTGDVIGASIIAVDSHERRQEASVAAHQQRLESIGRLAGGVAHDFNNVITVILGHAAFAKDLANDRPELAEDLQQIVAAGQRGAGLTRQLLTYARKDIVEPRVVDVANTVKGLTAFLRRLLGEDVRMSIPAPPPTWPTLIDHGQLEQVIINLATNARDAMPEGGELSFAVRNQTLNFETAKLAGVAAGDYVVLTASDTGCGMSQELMARIFDPFFTTKRPGDGTGLGLAMCDSIVRHAGGAIVPVSELGNGSKFSVLLPRTLELAAVVGDSEHERFCQPGNVLLIEDERTIREICCRSLTAAGFVVHAVGSGEAALAMPHNELMALQLIVSDVVLPGLNGRAAVERLRGEGVWPAVLYISGYTEDEIVKRGIRDARVAFLSKPFHPTDLVRAAFRAIRADAATAARPVENARAAAAAHAPPASSP
jgi:signal transduction histidine kinase/FixJ family two-component response regulator/integral membrane sensor domain MASE1